MALIRSTREIAEKWTSVTPLRSTQYEAGIESPLRPWEKNTLEASRRRDEGLQKAIADGRIDRGIKRVGQDGWKADTLAKGPTRWPEGVRLGGPKYEARFGPYRDVIEKTDAGPKYPAGDPRNWERSKKIGLALHEKKIRG